jgi:hypothetical protein
MREQVPQFVYENRHVYGVISKGIHELSEEECLDMFPFIRATIVEMLTDANAADERERAREQVAKSLAAVRDKLSAKPG